MTTATSTPEGSAVAAAELHGVALPGAIELDAETRTALARAWAKRASSYRPRTHHLLPDGAPSTPTACCSNRARTSSSTRTTP
jgi:hypothetical protein